ncbi:MAG TPA: DUF3341 domain-containing protein [Oligoflexia bacterium]|nr:DUF3341 domain-containing protein [Oligoflexia bacterium]
MSCYLVLAHFDSAARLAHAINEVRQESPGAELETFQPFPDHEVEEALYAGKRPSSVSALVLLGGIAGCLSGFLLTAWMSIDYPIRVGAKPLISWPAFVVIAFECTVLVGALSAIAGLCLFGRVPGGWCRPEYRASFSEGAFGLSVRAEQPQCGDLEQKLYRAGAEKVEVVYAR